MKGSQWTPQGLNYDKIRNKLGVTALEVLKLIAENKNLLIADLTALKKTY